MKVRKDSGEEIPHIQSKEQWLHFAGVAMKRYPTPKVRETQVKTVGVARGHQRTDTLKPYSQKRWTGRPGVLQFMGLQRVGHD